MVPVVACAVGERASAEDGSREHETQSRQRALHASVFIGFSRRFAIAAQPFRVHVFAGIRRVGETPTSLFWIIGNQKIGSACNLIRMSRQIVSNLLYSMGWKTWHLSGRQSRLDVNSDGQGHFSRRGYEYETTRTGAGSLIAAVLLVVARHAARTCAYGAGSRAHRNTLRAKLDDRQRRRASRRRR